MSYAESNGYADAVGDLEQLADPAVAAKWGPSIGLFQIRSLRNPDGWGARDRVRIAEKLRDPEFNAAAAFTISLGGANWEPWSVYRNGTFRQWMLPDYEIRTGHPRADQWDA